jgi:predicted TIM-barrel fold metal-dependent hydrolase
MRVTDVAAFLGPYPFRHLPHASPEWLLRQMDRLRVERAWVGYLPAFLHKDPAPGNVELMRLASPHAERLVAIPTVLPGRPNWEEDLSRAVDGGAPAIRLYPQYAGLDPSGPETRVLAAAAAMAKLPLLLTVRFEDLRQRHPMDSAPDLSAAAIRALIRSDTDLRLVVTHAGREVVEEVHFGLTPGEAGRILWDISWLWGPPEDHLRILLRTVGAERFVLGTGAPLRILDSAITKLALLDSDDHVKRGVLGGNLAAWLQGGNETSRR